MSDEVTVYQSEVRQGRAAVATFLRQLADGIEAGRVVLRQGGERVVVEPPDQLEVEVELELEDEGEDGIQSSLEVEISWFDTPAGGGERN